MWIHFLDIKLSKRVFVPVYTKLYIVIAGILLHVKMNYYRGADKSLARPTSRCILFDGENISFDASLVIYRYIVLIFLHL